MGKEKQAPDRKVLGQVVEGDEGRVYLEADGRKVQVKNARDFKAALELVVAMPTGMCEFRAKGWAAERQAELDRRKAEAPPWGYDCRVVGEIRRVGSGLTIKYLNLLGTGRDIVKDIGRPEDAPGAFEAALEPIERESREPLTGKLLGYTVAGYELAAEGYGYVRVKMVESTNQEADGVVAAFVVNPRYVVQPESLID